MLAWVDNHTRDAVFSKVLLKLHNAAVFIRNTLDNKSRVF